MLYHADEKAVLYDAEEKAVLYDGDLMMEGDVTVAEMDVMGWIYERREAKTYIAYGMKLGNGGNSFPPSKVLSQEPRTTGKMSYYKIGCD